ncbi:G-protein coupled receptor 151-like [Hemicordylus capensis]|uniref:G-protein coupled receptor 151-like n=1 Tax=Hemicordylus capensis TaxID=884348 RepID=UPI00230295C9|nr:G-protein coupled receptor 151-like [Hemicordylus capensis]
MNRSAPAVSAGGAPTWWAAQGGAEVTVVLPLVLAGLCTAGLAGNLLLLLLLAHQLRRGKSSPAHAWLLNLCAADLGLALYGVPARIAAYARRSWVLGRFVCKTSDWLLQGCLVAKSLSWAAVAHARYRSALSSASCKCPGWSWRRRAGLLGAAWLAALLLPLPQLLFAEVAPAARSGSLACLFQAPGHAATFMDIFSKVYPVVASLVPAGFTCSCYWRALRLRAARKKNRLARPGAGGGPPSQKATWALLCLSILFHAMWLPQWVLWLWERHRRPSGQSPAPPAALAVVAELLLFLNSALSPGVFMATSGEFREGLRSLWTALSCRKEAAAAAEEEGPPRAGPSRAAAGENPQPLRDLSPEVVAAAGAEKVLPDVEHFWKDRRNTTAGEESDPVPWEHQ